MTARTRTEMLTQINTLLADNTAGDISAADLRSALIDIRDSVLVWSGESYVISVNGSTGAVTLTPAGLGAATAAQGVLADTAVQPADIAGLVSSVNGETGVVSLDAADVGAATAAEGALAATAVQPAAIANMVTSSQVNTISQVTQAEYDAIGAPDANTLYVIVG